MYENIYYINPTFLNITDRALVYRNTIVELIKSLPRSRAFLQYFEVVKEPIFQTLLQLFLPVGSLYLEHINASSLRLSSAGVFLKWYDANSHLVAQRFTAFTASNASQTTTWRWPSTSYTQDWQFLRCASWKRFVSFEVVTVDVIRMLTAVSRIFKSGFLFSNATQ